MRLLAALLILLSGLAHAAREARLDVAIADPRDEAHVAVVLRAWREADRDLRALGLTLPDARLHAAASADDFARRTGEAWVVAAITRGTTLHTQRLGALAARGTLALTVRHEAFHVAQPRSLPRWLAEGLARVFSGEAARDPIGTTGLESLSARNLDVLLANRDERRLTAAYREATRRAQQMVKEKGWARALRSR